MSWQVEGYAARWALPFVESNGGYFQLSPECFAWDASTLPVWFMHNASRVYLRGEAGGLHVWQDHNGLAFRIASSAMTSREMMGLAAGIGEGRYCEVSASFWPRRSRLIPAPLGACALVERGELVELSICPTGACPGTGVWFSSHAHDLNLIPANARDACAAFQREQVARQTPSRFSSAAGSTSFGAFA
ncbi:MAG: hypothetical protein NXH88_04605 [Hyphomonas sp.]|nr:hypothetical protein [Hyphomonas sp.]